MNEDHPMLAISDNDVRTIEAVILLSWANPILLSSLGEILRDPLKAYPPPSIPAGIREGRSGYGLKILSSWLRKFPNLFEVRPVPGKPKNIWMCGLTHMDEEYWNQGPSSPKPRDLFDIPDLSIRAKLDGIVDSIKKDKIYFRLIIINVAGVPEEHIVPIIFPLRVKKGSIVKKSDSLIDNSVLLPQTVKSPDSLERFRHASLDPKADVQHASAPKTLASADDGTIGQAHVQKNSPIDASESERDNTTQPDSDKKEHDPIDANPGEFIEGELNRIGASVFEPVSVTKDALAATETLKNEPTAASEPTSVAKPESVSEPHPMPPTEPTFAIESTPVVKPESAPEQDPTPTPAPESASVPNPESKPELESGDAEGGKPEEYPDAERKAILAFKAALEEAGWHYSLRDIVRFHTSVRCEPLTILGGAPGSGKSSLARMYASYFGLGEDNNFLSIDVQPSWHDRMDFLGFVKTHEDTPEFVPSETGVAKFLKDAETDNGKSGIWLACLEEINLARPEHYFADFLQRISLDDDKRKKSPVELRGLPEGKEEEGRFTLVPSVRFIGTCNFDETTQNFSARFLDRCNYIEFQPLHIIDAFFPVDGKYPKLLEFDFDTKSKWVWHPLEILPRKRMDADPNEKEVRELIKKCEESLKTLGVLPSPRVVSSMIRYIEARIDSVKEELTDEKDSDTSTKPTTVFQRAFDEAIAQRILSKLSISRGCYPGTGTKQTLENLKENLVLGKVPLSLCSEIIEQYIRQFNTTMNS